MRFTPKTEEQVSNVWPVGEYDFVVLSAEETTSSRGNDMIALVLQCYHSDGRKKQIKDWLVEAMAFKLRHFAYTVGLGHAYESGEFHASDCNGRNGRVKLRIESDETGQYPDKNVVADYIVADSTKATNGYQKAKAAPAPFGATKSSAQSAPHEVVTEDDIPF